MQPEVPRWDKNSQFLPLAQCSSPDTTAGGGISPAGPLCHKPEARLHSSAQTPQAFTKGNPRTTKRGCWVPHPVDCAQGQRSHSDGPSAWPSVCPPSVVPSSLPRRPKLMLPLPVPSPELLQLQPSPSAGLAPPTGDSGGVTQAGGSRLICVVGKITFENTGIKKPVKQ